MPHFSPILFAIAFAALVVAITALGRRLPVPPPILQVLAGALLGFLPWVKVPHLEPDVVFFVFLPPILWAAAYFTSLREFKANIRPISYLAVGLVLATAAAVAVVARMLLPGMPWAVAVALGAIVSPPDAVAATAIVSRLPVPRRVIVLLEGESLVNDASALVLYRTAVAAAVTGMFSLGESVVRFFLDAGIGTAIGIAVGWLIIFAARRSRDPMADTVLTLAGPYLAWIAAESLHVSAVLACVSGGIYLRQQLSTAVSPISRIQARAVWDLVVFVLNAMIFLLLGLQFAEIVKTMPADELLPLFVIGAKVGALVIVVRLLWVPVATFLPGMLGSSSSRRNPRPDRKAVFLVSWTSMRGIISLATALALPFSLADGSPFPFRAEIMVITISVIMMTLILQGLSLSPIIRAFRFTPETAHEAEWRMARRESLRRGSEKLDDLAREPWASQQDVAWLRSELGHRLELLDEDGSNRENRRLLRAKTIDAERVMLVRLRNEGAISDDVLRDLEEDLDLESLRSG